MLVFCFYSIEYAYNPVISLYSLILRDTTLYSGIYCYIPGIIVNIRAFNVESYHYCHLLYKYPVFIQINVNSSNIGEYSRLFPKLPLLHVKGVIVPDNVEFPIYSGIPGIYPAESLYFLISAGI